MRNRTNAAKALDLQLLRRRVSCWLLERTDGTKFYFTDHNQKIDFDGNTYVPAGGFNQYARENDDGVDASNSSVVGVLSSSAITHDDLRAGKYRDAVITQYIIDRKYPWAGYIFKNIYYLHSASFDGEVWRVDISGPARLLHKPVGKYYTRNCRHTLGDDLCKIDMTNWRETGKAVTQIDTQRLVFRTSAITLANSVVPSDGDLNYGYVDWKTGNNAGIKGEIKNFTQSGAIIEIQIKTPFDIQIGDTFDVYMGCNKLQDTCKNTFSNFVNFGGFPFIPGTDASIRTARNV